MSGPTRQLTAFDAICIIVGVIIGSSIYKTSPFIAQNVGSSLALIGVWSLGGIIAFLGALCYAELTTTYPEDGGDYIFISRAFGRRAGFLFAWSEYWIVRPGNIGMMAFVFATFAQKVLPLNVGTESVSQAFYAAGAIAVLSVLNLLGVKAGKATQNILTTTKVIGLIVVIVVGLMIAPAANPATTTTVNASPNTDFRLALILVLFAYGGWNEVSYVAAEMRNPQRDLFRALLGGIALVTTVYVLVNLAFLRVLSLSGTASAQAVAADVLTPTFGDWAGRLINVLVCVSALGAINGMLFTGARIYYVVGKEHSIVAWLGRWSSRLDAPVRSLAIQASITIALVLGFGWYESGFERLFNFTAPVYWFFAFMVGTALLVLRAREASVPRPHPVPLYPWIPLFFCLTCAVLCESSFIYALSQGGGEAYWAGVLMLAGVAVIVLFDHDVAM